MFLLCTYTILALRGTHAVVINKEIKYVYLLLCKKEG